jgi:hypothetical protein
MLRGTWVSSFVAADLQTRLWLVEQTMFTSGELELQTLSRVEAVANPVGRYRRLRESKVRRQDHKPVDEPKNQRGEAPSLSQRPKTPWEKTVTQKQWNEFIKAYNWVKWSWRTKEEWKYRKLNQEARSWNWKAETYCWWQGNPEHRRDPQTGIKVAKEGVARRATNRKVV